MLATTGMYTSIVARWVGLTLKSPVAVKTVVIAAPYPSTVPSISHLESIDWRNSNGMRRIKRNQGDTQINQR